MDTTALFTALSESTDAPKDVIEHPSRCCGHGAACTGAEEHGVCGSVGQCPRIE